MKHLIFNINVFFVVTFFTKPLFHCQFFNNSEIILSIKNVHSFDRQQLSKTIYQWLITIVTALLLLTAANSVYATI